MNRTFTAEEDRTIVAGRASCLPWDTIGKQIGTTGKCCHYRLTRGLGLHDPKVARSQQGPLPRHAADRQASISRRGPRAWGKTLPFVFKREANAVATLRQRIATGSIVHADEAGGWDALHAHFEMRRINQSVAFSLGGACTNQAESFFSRLRRAEMGQHHHISGKYLISYALEIAWREDDRRQTNGALHMAATGAALGHPVSRVWKGYWQKGKTI